MPDQPSMHESSGQFRLRVPRTLHADLAREAKAQGVSLNSYVMYLLSTRHSQEMAWQEASAAYARQLRDTVREVHDMVLNLNFGEEPEPGGFAWRSTGGASILVQ
jgi:hypothetical protein